MSDLVCGTCHEPIIDGQGRYHPTHRYGKNSPHFHVACGETDPRDARIAELEAALTVFSARQDSGVSYVSKAVVAYGAMTAPHVLYKPTLEPDGTKWCALFGADLMVGVAGFGDTPEQAMAEFDKAWRSQKTPAAMLAANPTE